MVRRLNLKTRDEWLKKRQSFIGGSDASSIIGVNPYMTNQELWEIKTGRRKQADISDKPYVKYGIDAEPIIRKLFQLNHPEYKVSYVNHNIWLNDKYPFAHASLDGWIVEKETKQKGILEIKTTNIVQSMQKEKWGTSKEPSLPSNYYCQCLWYLLVTEFDFVKLMALLRYDNDYSAIREYTIKRDEVENDIEYLKNAAIKFAEQVQNDIRPGLILPSI